MQLRKFAPLGLALIAPLGLSGCLLLPGEFTSEMTIQKSGEFTFAYNGQIQLVGLANLLNNELEGEDVNAEFAAACYGEAPTKEGKDEKKKEEQKKKSREKAVAESAATEASIAKITSSTTGTAASRTSEEDPELSSDPDAASSDEEDGTAAGAAAAAAGAAAAAAGAVAEGDEAMDETSDGDSFEERDCTTEEIADQIRNAARRKKSKARKCSRLC
jgi:hypothetical protein